MFKTSKTAYSLKADSARHVKKLLKTPEKKIFSNLFNTTMPFTFVCRTDDPSLHYPSCEKAQR